jgi:hypothetical protein
VVDSEVEMVAADRHIQARERRIDGIRALQLRRTSLPERGSIDAEAFFTEMASGGGENGITQAAERIPVMRRQCEKST